MDDNPFERAAREARKRFFTRFLIAAIAIPVVGGSIYGLYKAFHTPGYSEQLDMWNEEFGAIATESAKVNGPASEPTGMSGRKILFLSSGSPHQEINGTKKVDGFAKKASEVGLVITAETKEDQSRSVTYTNGSHGYGGRSTFRAIAWPEKKLVGELHTSCVADFVTYSFRGDNSDSHCYWSDDDAVAFIADVRAGQIPRRHSTDPQLDEAFAREAKFAKVTPDFQKIDLSKLPSGGTPPGSPKVLIVTKEGLRQELAGDFAAQTPEEVNLVLVLSAIADPKPTTYYGGNAHGYEGTVTVLAITPDKKLVKKTEIRCRPPSSSLPELGDEFCTANADQIGVFIRGLGAD